MEILHKFFSGKMRLHIYFFVYTSTVFLSNQQQINVIIFCISGTTQIKLVFYFHLGCYILAAFVVSCIKR